jgi:hypothetical protein
MKNMELESTNLEWENERSEEYIQTAEKTKNKYDFTDIKGWDDNINIPDLEIPAFSGIPNKLLIKNENILKLIYDTYVIEYRKLSIVDNITYYSYIYYSPNEGGLDIIQEVITSDEVYEHITQYIVEIKDIKQLIRMSSELKQFFNL